MKTVSLELSKQLKDAGYPQSVSEFNWIRVDERVELSHKDHEYLLADYKSSIEKECVSPTADEILDQLPNEIVGDEGMKFDLDIWKDNDHNSWVISYWWDEDTRHKSDTKIQSFEHSTLAEAVAKMWLYLKKGELI